MTNGIRAYVALMNVLIRKLSRQHGQRVWVAYSPDGLECYLADGTQVGAPEMGVGLWTRLLELDPAARGERLSFAEFAKNVLKPRNRPHFPAECVARAEMAAA